MPKDIAEGYVWLLGHRAPYLLVEGAIDSALDPPALYGAIESVCPRCTATTSEWLPFEVSGNVVFDLLLVRPDKRIALVASKLGQHQQSPSAQLTSMAGDVERCITLLSHALKTTPRASVTFDTLTCQVSVSY